MPKNRSWGGKVECQRLIGVRFDSVWTIVEAVALMKSA